MTRTALVWDRKGINGTTLMMTTRLVNASSEDSNVHTHPPGEFAGGAPMSAAHVAASTAGTSPLTLATGIVGDVVGDV